jgi:hypothetical protein
MTDTEEHVVEPVAEPTVEVEPTVEAEEVQLEPKHCRWCGAYHEVAVDEPEDWLCPECERYQDAMACPTCGNLARVSVLPADAVPAPVKPKNQKRKSD